MLRQRLLLGVLAAAGLLTPSAARAQLFTGDRPSEMTAGRSYSETYGPGYRLYVPSATFAGSYNFYPGKYTGLYLPSRFATTTGYYATMSSGYTPTLFTSLNYPEVYGSYILGAGPLVNVAPSMQTRPDNPPSDNPVGAPYAPLSRPLAEVPLYHPQEVALTARLEPPARPALIDVTVPADAVLSFQGKTMTEETGALRQFQSPPLNPGRTYSYDVRATWKDDNGREVTRTRHLTVRAGDRLSVDLTRGSMPRVTEPEEVPQPELRTTPPPNLRRVPRE
jgi:uncharacterized protein (TIGR03000 family)